MMLMSAPNLKSWVDRVSEKLSTNWNRFSVRPCG
jgi:hypothetical protein